MIPKIIHYCWFGKADKPEKVKEYIESWKNKLPDFQFMEWNEKRFDINSSSYVREAYENKKYAFVSDVARMYALYNYGGIYLDTDIEIKKDLKKIIEYGNSIFGFEMGGANIMTAFMAFDKGNDIARKMLDYYNSHKFVQSDGSFDITPNTVILTNILKEKGAVMNNEFQCINDGIKIYPEEYFSAFEMRFYREISTENTYTVHHFESSWKPKYVRFRFIIKKIIIKIIGTDRYKKIYTAIKS
ncbi:glycosyltransferase family 32 protein [uncultured Clostridium sp.]|uniref:glycosyltransferase family 32 protein n=1 Tax=uncultured Clostridium sp. TaxID=59620 RepID=UPI0025CD3575|nr:glycosyltransferase [uncultured Clostridium sp.]